MGTASRGFSRPGATVVITHRVREHKHADYETWLNEIAPLCKAFPGHLDWHIVRQITGLTGIYTVIIRFDTAAHLQQWMESSVRARLIEKVLPLFVTVDFFFISSGLDFWFTPGGRQSQGARPLEAVPGDMVRHLPVGTGRTACCYTSVTAHWRY
jgi:antibiotic biosynthesis monooxygenase (ABM) superfamily enzyme